MAFYFRKNFVASVLLVLLVVMYEVISDNTCDIDIESTLKSILYPPESPSIQVQSLRRDLLKKFQEALERVEAEDEMNYKRSLASLARWNNLPVDKRNLEALARAGYIKTIPDDEEEDANNKRSIANLAKNGQLPMRDDEQKRGIEALARNGDLHPRKDIQELMDELYGKRNLGSIRNSYYPSYGKKSLSSLAKSGDLNYQKSQYKRNIASLARDGKFTGKRDVQDDYLNGIQHKQAVDNKDDKRSLQSIKAQYKPKFKRSTEEVKGRDKRQADYYYYGNDEYSSPVYQNQNANDYEDLIQDLTEAYPEADKRFLGKLPQTVKPNKTPSPKSRRYH